MTAMRLAEIWRYPVKSMAGEQLTQATLDPLGRALTVVDRGGRVVTARRRPRLLGLGATTSAAGDILVDGLPWRDEEVGRLVREAAGEGTRLAESQGEERFDILPLLVATDGAVALLRTDRRRLRPNLLIGGVRGADERSWERKLLRVGLAAVGLADLRQRCIMTTWDPDTGAQDVGVLRAIQRQFGGSLALNAWTAESGPVAVGDVVELVASGSGRPAVRPEGSAVGFEIRSDRSRR